MLENFRLKNTYKLHANVCKHLEHLWMRAILHFTSGHCRHHHRASQDSIQNHIRITELIESAKLHDRISEESVGTGTSTCTCIVYTVQYRTAVSSEMPVPVRAYGTGTVLISDLDQLIHASSPDSWTSATRSAASSRKWDDSFRKWLQIENTWFLASDFSGECQICTEGISFALRNAIKMLKVLWIHGSNSISYPCPLVVM